MRLLNIHSHKIHFVSPNQIIRKPSTLRKSQSLGITGTEGYHRHYQTNCAFQTGNVLHRPLFWNNSTLVSVFSCPTQDVSHVPKKLTWSGNGQKTEKRKYSEYVLQNPYARLLPYRPDYCLITIKNQRTLQEPSCLQTLKTKPVDTNPEVLTGLLAVNRKFCGIREVCKRRYCLFRRSWLKYFSRKEKLQP